MGTQVNNLREKQALQAVKAYVDNQATAQVIRTETVLYTSTTGDALNQILTLNDDMTNYDALVFHFGMGTDLTSRSNSEEVSAAEFANSRIVSYCQLINASYLVSEAVQRVTNTTIKVVAMDKTSAWASTATGVYKITGVKYTVPETYTTTEQIVGTWIDGKALYRRVIEIPEVQAVDRNWTLLLTDPTFLNTIDKLISAKFLTPIGTHLPLDTKIQDGKFYLWVSPGGDRINTIIIEYTKTGGA